MARKKITKRKKRSKKPTPGLCSMAGRTLRKKATKQAGKLLRRCR